MCNVGFALDHKVLYAFGHLPLLSHWLTLISDTPRCFMAQFYQAAVYLLSGLSLSVLAGLNSSVYCSTVLQ